MELRAVAGRVEVGGWGERGCVCKRGAGRNLLGMGALTLEGASVRHLDGMLTGVVQDASLVGLGEGSRGSHS